MPRARRCCPGVGGRLERTKCWSSATSGAIPRVHANPRGRCWTNGSCGIDTAAFLHPDDIRPIDRWTSAREWRILSGVTPHDHIVFVVDDDRGICEALTDLLSSFDLHVVAFGSAAEYIAYPKPDLPACLVLDVELPDANGLDLQSQTGQPHPQIVFITGHGGIPKSVRAMKAGAVDFLTKPLNESDLIRAIRAAITQDRTARQERTELVELHRRLTCLTPREREVLPLVVSGLLNKQAAAELGISEITIQIHRSKVMQKMQATSLADRVRIAEKLNIPVIHSRRPG